MAVPAAFIHRRLRLLPPSINILRRPPNQKPQSSGGVRIQRQNTDGEEIALISKAAPTTNNKSIESISWRSPKSILKFGGRPKRRHTIGSIGSSLANRRKG